MALTWYYVENGESVGPITEDEFDAKMADGTIRPDTLVWKDGMGDWVASGTLAQQAPAGAAPATPAFGQMATGTQGPRGDASTFMGALKDGFRRYVDFGTRSNRPQFWWWTLWMLILGIAAGIVDGIIGGSDYGVVGLLLSLATFLPSIAVAIRRLHDIGRSGWWYLLIFIPIVGWIVLLVFYCTRSEERANQWGPVPR